MTKQRPGISLAMTILSVVSLPFTISSNVQGRQESAEANRQPSAGMMRYPDVSKTQIAFSYAGDLWVVDRAGGVARPLASPSGRELFPRFNAAGDKIAFVGKYDGDNDLYVIDVNGGNPERMTWHPEAEVLCDWNPDGSLLYFANGFSGLQRVMQLFTISKEKPLGEQVAVPYGSNGAISDNGKWLAYTPHSHDNRTWKRYRGGMASNIWLFNLETHESRQATEWEGTDSLPMWHGGKVYYLSDEGPQQKLNIWEFDPASGNRRQVTDFADFDCKWPSMGPGTEGKGEIILQNGASLWLIDLANGKRTAVNVTVPGDKPSVRSRLVDVADFIEAADVSPKAKRLVVEARGDIWSLPVKSGSPRNLTRTNGVAERMPAWSPDGQWIAYFSDQSGEYELYVRQSDGRSETKQLTRDGSSWRYNPVWSPDSKQVVFTDKAGNIFLHTIESGETKLVDTDPTSTQLSVSWSHDSLWLTYARATDTAVPSNAVWVYSLASGEKHQLTNFFPCANPVFDRKGDYIFCSSNRAFNRPSYEDVGQSFIYSGTEVLLAIPLRTDVKQPLLPESDEETWKDGDKDESKEGKDADKSEEDSDDDDADSDEDESKDDSEDKSADSDESDPVSGTWSGRVLNDEMPADQRNFTLSLSLADDGTITGSVNTHQGSLDITSGKFHSETGEVTITASGGDVTAVITGTIKDGKFTGSAFVEAAGLNLDLEATKDASSSDSSDDDEDESGDEKKKDKEKEAKPVTIDFEGIEQRMWQIPVSQGNFGVLGVNDKGHLIYARRPSRAGEDEGDGGTSIKIFDITDKDKAEKDVVDGGGGFGLTPDGKKLLVSQGQNFYVVDAAAGQKLTDKISTEAMKTTIDPKTEWRQVFREAWRIERDFFYDPNMHGVAWPAVYDRYSAMIDECTSRADLGFLISEMISEINVGHAYYRAADDEDSGESENTGLPGCRFAVDNGRYKVAEIFEGAAWDTDARNPLRSVGIKEGDFVLAVNGIPLESSRNPYSALVGLANKIVTLTVSEDATPSDDDKQIAYKLLADDNDLRFRAWIERNRKYIDEKTGGKVGYIYVVNTGVPGQNDLFRQFYGQAEKEALIIDDRWNGGGQIPTRFVELLNRPVTNYWAKRDGRDWTWPPDSHQGPKCMLINGMAGSGGDMFPALFKQAGVGKLVGMRTWGGLVGISGNPSLIDGSSVTAPTFAYYEKDGTWGIEGHGVDPDIRVVDDPAKMMNGGDPQMDVAIELMLKEIEANGFAPPSRPAYPDRSKMGLPDSDK